MPTPPPYSALRAGLDAQFTAITELTRRSADVLRSLSELHIHASALMVQDSVSAARQLLASGDPLQVAATLLNAGHSGFEHWRNYQQQLFGMFSGVQRDLSRQAGSLLAEASSSGAALGYSLAGGDTPPFAARATGAPHQRS
jgi:hypothetical protein